MGQDKEKRKNDKGTMAANPLLMVKPNVTGTPLGPLSIAPIPVGSIEDNKEKPKEDDKEL